MKKFQIFIVIALIITSCSEQKSISVDDIIESQNLEQMRQLLT